MRLRFFGDSYDIVKQCFISWLAAFGDWAIHPMLTESVTSEWASQFARFAGARLLSEEVLTAKTDRQSYFESSHKSGNLFLDPDKGLWMKPNKPEKQALYLLGSELVSLAHARPKALTLIFDQSISRDGEKPQIQVETKLGSLASAGVSGFAYISHASFLIVSRDSALINKSYQGVLSKSRLPEDRFVRSKSALTLSASSSI